MGIELTLPIALGLVIGLTQAVKTTFPNSKKYAPIISLIFGLGFSILFVPDLKESILAGLVLGLSAGGFYSGAKSLTTKK